MPEAQLGLAEVVDASFRRVGHGSAALVVMMAGLLVWLTLFSRPATERYEDGLGALQDAHSAMLDEQTGVRGFLTSGDPLFLQAYDRGRANLIRADARLLRLAGDDELVGHVVDLRLAQDRWTASWAAVAVRDHASYRPGSPGLADFLRTDKRLFDAYRVVHGETVTATAVKLRRERREQTAALSVITASGLLVGLLLAAATVSRRRLLHRDVLTPVGALLDGLEAVRQGRFDQRVRATGPSELLRIVEGFNRMTQALAESRQGMEEREAEVQQQAARLREILKMVRDIGGSLSLRYVLEAVTQGALGVSGARGAVVWLVRENETVLYAAGSSDPEDLEGDRSVELGTGVVGRAAKYGRAATGVADDASGEERLAVPLIVGARVVGVLELALAGGGQLGDEQVEVLETLSIHAATAIEAARLHQVTEYASEHDALTGLANRRRLEQDLRLECERSLRYGRPLAFVMIDLDHFKRLNDTYGHARGDEVLQGVAECIRGALRATDSAYRYGGEELVVLVRESDAEGAVILAERIRDSIQRRYQGHGESGVTASLGVAAFPAHAASAQGLSAAADTALYAAKQGGRNRVVVAGEQPPPQHDLPKSRPSPMVAASPHEALTQR